VAQGRSDYGPTFTGQSRLTNLVPLWYHFRMAMNLRLSPKQTEELRKSAAQDGISMQEAALAAIDAYTSRRNQRLKEAINRIATEDAELLKRLAQ
jgi:hypothetical protein